MKIEQNIKRARQLFYNKKKNSDFQYFNEKGCDYFVKWYLGLEKRCVYCGIEEHKLQELFSNKLSTKRKRGKSLELERFDSDTNVYDVKNCGLACYFYNNHKSDIISKEEHVKYFAKPINRYLNALYNDPNKVIDAETNFLYLSDKLQTKFSGFCNEFISALEREQVQFEFLEGTKDVWAVDYMPVQTQTKKFVQFVYNPDYLRDYPSYHRTITNPELITSKLNLDIIKSKLIIDGGNIIKSKSKAIMTNKVFIENNKLSSKEVIQEIESFLDLQLITIPIVPKDFIGHADGMVRFYDEDTVLVNDYSKESPFFHIELQMALRNAGLKTISIPYNVSGNQNDLDARGIYINYLQMKGKIFLPTFDLPEDDLAIDIFKNLFIDCSIIPVRSIDIAKQGGVLNCITWNVKK